jgi:hypothetical protein
MAKFDFRRFVREDYPDSEEWFGNFLVPLNVALEQIKSALTGNLTIRDNLRQELVSFTVQTPANYTPDASPPAGWNRVQFAVPNRFNVTGVLIVNAVESASSYNPVTASSITWRQLTNEQITILYIGGLKPSTKYTITALVI